MSNENRPGPDLMAAVIEGIKEALKDEGYPGYEIILFAIRATATGGSAICGSSLPPPVMKAVIEKQIERMDSVKQVLVDLSNTTKQ